jgi:hypothetical protein
LAARHATSSTLSTSLSRRAPGCVSWSPSSAPRPIPAASW